MKRLQLNRSRRFVSQGNRYALEMTPLNVATSIRYADCRGRHVASGETVMRDWKSRYLQLPICERCGVPFGTPRNEAYSL